MAISNTSDPYSQRLRQALEQVADRYDLIVMDTPPALGMLSLNAIAAADMILMPITPNFTTSPAVFNTLQSCPSWPAPMRTRW